MIWNPACGIWETMQPDLSGRPAPFSAIWSTRGKTHDGSAYRLRLSALLTTASASSSSPTPTTLFRTPLASDSSRGGETLERVRARRGTITLSHQIIDLALHGPDGSPNNNNEPQTLWSLIEDIFGRWGRCADAIARWEHITGRTAPAPALLNEDARPKPSPEFVEWIMSLPVRWVTDPPHGLTQNQQTAPLGNGVLPLQAVLALEALTNTNPANLG